MTDFSWARRTLVLVLLFGVTAGAAESWFADAVWYQIFPERFRNGDPTNDPTRASLEGTWPYFVPDGWDVVPWTSDWYQLQPWETDGKGFYVHAQLRRYGGDLQGIIDKLDYLKDLGVNTLYLNPVFESASLHKYGATMYHHIDKHFGPDPQGDLALFAAEDASDVATWRWSAADRLFLQLIAEVHKRDMRIIIDGVFNHVGIPFWAFQRARREGSDSPFAKWFHISRWDDLATTEDEFDYQGWVGIKDLPEFRKDERGPHPEVKDHIRAVLRRWMDPNGDGDPSDGIDGWRLDVAAEVPLAFWKECRGWVKAINPEAYLTGEIWWDDYEQCTYKNAQPWLDGAFDAVMNYRFGDAAYQFFNQPEPITATTLVERLGEIHRDYGYRRSLDQQNLLGSHDTSRVGSAVVNPQHRQDHGANLQSNRAYKVHKPNAAEKRRWKQMVAFQFLAPGAPYIYYGDEVGMWGADDPDCRKPMVWDDLSYATERAHPFGLSRPADTVEPDTEMLTFYRRVTQWRRDYPALRQGTFTVLLADDARRLVAFRREHDGVQALAIFNGSERACQVAWSELGLVGSEPWKTVTGAVPSDDAISVDGHGFVLLVRGAAGPSALADPIEGFRDPPLSARPSVYWTWVNGLTDKDRMSEELEELKAKGIGGLYIFDVGARDPKGIVPSGPAFMGPESLDAIGHTVREATRLGMEVGLTTSSSWNCGGPWVPPEYASMGLYHNQVTVTGPKRLTEPLPMPTLPKRAPRGPDGRPAYVKDVAILAVPARGPVAEMTIESTDAIVDLTDRVDAQGHLDWDVPAGAWTIMRFVCANTGLSLRLPSPESGGLAIDHFNAEATKFHFQYLLDKLHGELGDFRDTALKQMYVCSYELSGSTWTPEFLAQFEKRRGYDMARFLPVLAGCVVENHEVTARFRYDYRKTLGDLLVDAFYRAGAELSNEHGLLLCAEAGGPGPPLHQVPVDALKALGALDIPRGEFWKDHDVWVVKETACAAHVYGKRLVDMEAFTSWRHWQDGPFELKPIADRAFCGGANHFTFHTSAHNPSATDRPGWVYHAGTHMGPSLAWWPKAKPWIDYLSRCSYMLQQGLFVADVCYYYGDQGFNFVPPKHIDLSLGFGYDYDVANAEVVLTRMRVEDGRMTLPDGMSYELLVLPEREDIDLAVLKKIERMVTDGATVVGPKPTRSNGLADHEHRDAEVRRIAERLWGPCDGKTRKEHAYGKGKIIWGRDLKTILRDRGRSPDFAAVVPHSESAYPIDYIHRRLGETAIYFVSNRTEYWQSAFCSFRAGNRTPQLWMPDTGEIRACQSQQGRKGLTQMRLDLPPHGSVFVVFGKNDDLTEPDGSGTATSKGGRVVGGPWDVRFPAGWGAPASKSFEELVSWTDGEEEGVRYFSGVASYHNEFDVDQLAEGERLFLDLGRVRFLAEVYVNGTSCGIVWKPPFRVEITEAARPGNNKLVVEVANTWSNRLVGDAQSPDGKQYCRTNIDKSLTWQAPWKETPLLESGLLGPVKLISGVQRNGK